MTVSHKLTALLIIIATLPIILAANLLFLKDPPVWPDEATSFHQAQALLQTGKINADNYGGIPIEAKRAGLGFPPLYFITLGVWTNVFGQSIESVRALSVTIATLTATIFFLIVRLKFNNIKLALFGTLLLTFNPYFGQTSRLGRPEILTLFIMMVSLCCWYFSKKTNPKYILLSGFLAALASASHPAGILMVGIIILGFLFLPLPLKSKILYCLWTFSCLILITFSWIILTQNSVQDFLKAFLLGLQGKSYNLSGSLALFTLADPIWATFLTCQGIVLLVLILSLFRKSKMSKAEDIFILLSVIISIIWAGLQKSFYDSIYPQPFIILGVLTIIRPIRPIRQICLILFLVLLSVYLQFFDISYYTPVRNFMQLDNFNYHQFVLEIKNNLPQKPITIFLSSIPDPFFDLRVNQNYTFYQAINPTYPISVIDYKETLDKTDYVIYTWIPHEFLAEYLANNTQRVIPVSQPEGYSATIVELKPRNQRQ